jgi:hypothetical protein
MSSEKDKGAQLARSAPWTEHKANPADRAMQHNIMCFVDNMLSEQRLDKTHAQIAATRQEEGVLEERDGPKTRSKLANVCFDVKEFSLLEGLCSSSCRSKKGFVPVPFSSEEQEAESIQRAARERAWQRYGTGDQKGIGSGILYHTSFSEKGLLHQVAGKLGLGRKRSDSSML